MIKILEQSVEEESLYKFIRSIRWKNGVHCPRCGSKKIRKHNGQEICNRYYCRDCRKTFNDLTKTIFASTKISLWKWILAIHHMSLGLSNKRIGQEIKVGKHTRDRICAKIRNSIWVQDAEKLKGIVEADELYQAAGEKGTKQVKRDPRKRGSKNAVGVLGIVIRFLLLEPCKEKL